MKLIAGLGNPGTCYALTRHNIGFRVLDLLAGKKGIAMDRYLYWSLYGQGRIGTQEVIFAKPLTYMNRSGESIVPLLQHFALGPEDLLVIYDDAALPRGKLRLRGRGSAGGHKGIGSVIARLGTDEFPRLRVGIGSPPPGMDLPAYVLSDFPPGEEEEMERAIAQAGRAVELYVTAGLVPAMTRINGPGVLDNTEDGNSAEV